MHIAPERIEDAAKELYVRALRDLPPDIKRGFAGLAARETGATAKAVLGTMIENIAVAERTGNLLCQDTGIPIYNVTIGRDAVVDGVAMKAAIRRGCERATRETPFRSSIVHPLTRENEHTSCGIGIPVIHVDFTDAFAGLRIEMIPKGSGSENNSWLRMAIPAEGVDAIKTFVVDCVLGAGGKTCPPTIVGVGIGGSADVCVHLAKVAATRALGTHCGDAAGAALEAQLTAAVNMLGVGPQGLGGDATAFAVHVELAATHITMNPVAVNMQCHSARRSSALIRADSVEFGYDGAPVFIGHFGVAMAAQKVAPGPSLGTLVLAAMLVDGVWPVFLLMGWEKVEIQPGITAVTPLLFVSYPYTHSLAAGLLWGGVLGGAYYLRRRDRAGALWLAALVVSHWVLDFVSHRPDMPLWPAGPAVGLGLWYSIPATLVVEFGLFGIGAWLYASATRARDRIGTYAFGAFVGVLAAIYVSSVFGPPPPSVQVLAMTGLLGWLFVVWAYWIGRHRAAVAKQ